MRFWMVRAGKGAYVVEDFEAAGAVAIGWDEAGDFTAIRSLDQMKQLMNATYPDHKKGSRAAAAASCFKFRHEMSVGDRVVTYDPTRREYLLGEITGDYRYEPGVIPDHNHVRDVRWQAKVSRDELSPSTKNSLGSIMTLFEPGDAVLRELEDAIGGEAASETQAADEAEDQRETIRRDILERSHEFIKDQIRSLSPEDLEELTAAVLRALGFRARVSPKGRDRGRDVIASPDGLGLQQPRIIAEVKHRAREQTGASQIRSFLGALQPQDRGLYVSTGGFSTEAKYEAERASVPVTLVDLDDLASLATEHYESFDTEGRAILPLVRVYWPAD